MKHILIVDFGSQYTHLMTKRLNFELGVKSELVLYTQIQSVTETSLSNVAGVILSGGPQTASDLDPNGAASLHAWFASVLSRRIPVLGVCFGMQWICEYFGGKVEPGLTGEFGKAELIFERLERTDRDDPVVYVGDTAPSIVGTALLPMLPLMGISSTQVWMSHQDKITRLPDSFRCIAKTKDCPYAFIEHSDHNLPIYGVQFHPEVEHTQYGIYYYKGFLSICGLRADYNAVNQNLVAQVKSEIKKQLSDSTGHVLLALSGGVDSSVLCAALQATVPDRLLCVFINHGLLRAGEADEICKRYRHLGNQFVCYDASYAFFVALAGVTEPEQKRKIIGRMFIESFEKVVRTHFQNYNVEWLAQGTIYPDVIESSGLGGTAKVIKSHHNVGGLPERMQLKLLEPMKYLFKDQVRVIGTELGLPENVINRHPFPGPGLGIRVVGEVTPQLVEIVQKADKIFLDHLHATGEYKKTSQAYAALLPVKTVGVVGDNRRWGWTIVLRAVITNDFMTAEISHLDYKLLETVATEIVNQCVNVSRVLYDITSKPPGTIEME